MTDKVVIIDAFVDGCARSLDGYAGVAIDIIRATTTAVTAAAMGRQCFPVPSLEAAVQFSRKIQGALLVGEIGGNKPYGFDMTNSPAEISLRNDLTRPVILLSSSGTRLMAHLEANGPAYIACFRNYECTVRHLARNHDRVAVIGAMSRGEFREEDQMCCAFIAAGLISAGFRPGDQRTLRITERWAGAAPNAFLGSKSVKYLRDTGQEHDLHFVLSHFNDLHAAFTLEHGEVVMFPETKANGLRRRGDLLRRDAMAPAA